MLVRNWLSPVTEKVTFITPDGLSFELHDPVLKATMDMNGWGIPDPSHLSTKGPFQDGETVIATRVPVRDVSLTFFYNACSRADYLANRTEIINYVRFNRTSPDSPSPGKLRWSRPDGIYQLDVFMVQGPVFPKNGHDNHMIFEEFKFRAYNPIIYSPERKSVATSDLICEAIGGLVFPFAYDEHNIIFGDDFCYKETTLTVEYEGNYKEFPTILITGPGDNLVIEHEQTGLRIALEDYSIAENEVVTITLTYASKAIISSNGQQLLGRLSDDSSLGLFAIQPSPIVVGGDNIFNISLENGNENSQVAFYYYDRFTGI